MVLVSTNNRDVLQGRIMSQTTSNSEQSVLPLVSHMLFGRRKIYTSVPEINESNVVDVVTKAYNVHLMNRGEIKYLYDYYKGKQPILERIKEIRPNICNNITINRAYEIVSFKVGYQCGNSMLYTASKSEEGLSAKVEELNNLMNYEDKPKKDKDLVTWQMICGTGYRIALPDDIDSEEDEAPFSISTLRPTDTFVIYSDRIGEKPMCGVTYWVDADYTGELGANGLQGYIFAVYTKDRYYEIKGGALNVFAEGIYSMRNTLGMIPIIEYPANEARLGAFEIVIDILDAISKVESNRLDNLESVVQSFLKFINCDITPEEYEEFLAKGAIKVASHEGKNADVDIVAKEISQDQAQTEVDDLYQTVLTICGIPSQGNGNSSDSSNNGAMIVKNGWSSAEARAKDLQLMFESSEKSMLKIVLKILRDKSVLDLKVSDIEIKAPRRNYEDLVGKVDALIKMLSNSKIDPKDAYTASGLFTDPETAYENGMKWYEQELDRYEQQITANEGDEDDVRGSGQATE